jgi:hypothetical protein
MVLHQRHGEGRQTGIKRLESGMLHAASLFFSYGHRGDMAPKLLSRLEAAAAASLGRPRSNKWLLMPAISHGRRDTLCTWSRVVSKALRSL